MKILGTGLSGLVGSRVRELLQGEYEIESLSRRTGVDITNKEHVAQAVKSSGADVILHLAAKTDVDACEDDKDFDMSHYFGKDIFPVGSTTAWEVNVFGTKHIAQAAQLYDKKLIYVSTDFVFDGNISTDSKYQEKDVPNPINWYGKTKYEGEKIVKSLVNPWLILRIAYPYTGLYGKTDFVRKIVGLLTQGERVRMVTDHIMTPTFIDDIAWAIKAVLEKKSRGTMHVVGSQSLSPYEAAIQIAQILDLNESLIQPTTRAVYFANRAQRPFRLALKNDKIQKLGIHMKRFDEGIHQMQKINIP